MKNNQRFVLIGLGTFGREIARTLYAHDADIIVMDHDSKVVNQMKSDGFKYAVSIDNLDPSTQARFIKPEDVVIISMGDAFEANILTIEILKEIGVRTIYSRATSDIQYRILQKMELSEILYPERQEGKRFALKLLNRDIHFINEFAPDLYLIEVQIPEKYAGKTIMDLKIRSTYNVNIIGLKQARTESGEAQDQAVHYVGFERTLLHEGHTLLVIGTEADLEEFVNSLK